MYTVKDLIKDLKDFPLDAEIRPLEYEEDKEDETCLFEIHCIFRLQDIPFPQRHRRYQTGTVNR